MWLNGGSERRGGLCSHSVKLRDFVLVEFARAWQEKQGAARVDPAVVQATRESPAFLEARSDSDRLLLYARVLLRMRLDEDEGQEAAAAIRGSLSAVRLLVPLVGMAAGFAMLSAALPAPDVRPVSVFQFVAEGVLLPGVFLLWTLLLTQALAGSVGRWHWASWVTALVRSRALDTQVGALAGRVLRRSGVAAPLFASLSHSFWLVSLAVFVGLGAWRFTFVDYLFSWSSTLSFTGEQVHSVFCVLVAPIEWFPGIEAPSLEQVRLSEFGSLGLGGGVGGSFVHSTADPIADQSLRKGWFSVLLAVVVVWGMLPRLCALGVARVSVRRSVARCLGDATSRMILSALTPIAPPKGGEPRREEPDAPPHRTVGAEDGSRAGRGLDLLVFATGEPNPELLKHLAIDRLGLSGKVSAIVADDDDDAMDNAIAHLASVAGPEGAVVTFGVEAIPDALKEEFVQRVVASLGADAPVHVLITGTDRFRRSPRGKRTEARVEAWRAMSVRAGVPANRVHSDGEAWG